MGVPLIHHISSTTAHDRVIMQIRGLVAMFGLGMLLNAIGETTDSTPAALKATDNVLLGLHGLVALGLLVSGGLLLRESNHSSRWHRLVAGGFSGITVAAIAGILTETAPRKEAWSLLMSASFVTAFYVYTLALKEQAKRAG